MAGRRIGFATDFSAGSTYALKWAVENLVKEGDYLILVVVNKSKINEIGEMHLWEHTGSPLIPLSDFLSAGVAVKYGVTQDVHTLSFLEQEARHRKVEVVFKVYWGDAREKVCDAIIEIPLDCIVMGSRGFGQLKRVEEIRAVWNSRWDWFHRPIHAVAHVLHPLWRSEDQLESDELEDGFMKYVERLAGHDVGMMRRIEDDLLSFRNHNNHFGRATAKLRETQLQPVSWWEKYGNCAPTLKRIAIRVLSQDCSSGSCERNWSTWALFHTKKRNKLTTAQLERLVFCNCNLKLLDRASSSPEPSQVNVDKIDIEKVRNIPDIPQHERDLYSMLYEEAIQPVHSTRAQGRRQRQNARIAEVDTESSSSSRSDDSLEEEEEEEQQVALMQMIENIELMMTPIS